MSMGILDFSTSSKNDITNITTTNNDSYNRSSTNSQVLDNVGNVSLTMGAPGDALDRWLPIMALALLVVGLLGSKG